MLNKNKDAKRLVEAILFAADEPLDIETIKSKIELNVDVLKILKEIRGVSFSTGTLEILFELGWVKPQGRKEIPGKPLLYVTTDTFLSHFNLKSLSDLPNSEELASAGLIDSRLDRSIFGTNKFAKDDLDKQSKEDIFSNIDDMLSETLNQKDN